MPEVFPAPAPAGKRAFLVLGSGRKKGYFVAGKKFNFFLMKFFYILIEIVSNFLKCLKIFRDFCNFLKFVIKFKTFNYFHYSLFITSSNKLITIVNY